MSDDEFEREVKDLAEMLKALRLIKDKGQRKRMKAEIRYQLYLLTKD